MKAFDVRLNGKPVCVAGIDGDVVLNTMIDYTAGHCGQRLSLSVGGFAAVSVVGRVGVMAQSWRTTQAITAQTKATIANQT